MVLCGRSRGWLLGLERQSATVSEDVYVERDRRGRSSNPKERRWMTCEPTGQIEIWRRQVAHAGRSFLPEAGVHSLSRGTTDQCAHSEGKCTCDYQESMCGWSQQDKPVRRFVDDHQTKRNTRRTRGRVTGSGMRWVPPVSERRAAHSFNLPANFPKFFSKCRSGRTCSLLQAGPTPNLGGHFGCI